MIDLWRLDFFTELKQVTGDGLKQSVHELVQAVEMCFLFRHSVTIIDVALPACKV